MPQDNVTNTPNNNTTAGQVPSSNGAEPVQAVSDVIVAPGPEPVKEEPAAKSLASASVQMDIATKLGEAKNVLIALSSDPSVDELAAAIGFSLYLDRIGKRATAIYSGATPNTLEFLKPEETFESTADTLQDFVIAINKEKADHLRYKLDGDYVKVYITPYKRRLSEADLEFSYGDYNVDLVMALDVANGIDLDAALREHGRIMHDAAIVNVTTGNPGKFGEIEWSDKKASSVSEMIANLLYKYGGEDPIAKDEATAFLTGVVAATNRFSNTKTTPETMRLASRLMESGANQVLVSKNITPNMENELFNNMGGSLESTDEENDADATKLDVEHDYERRAKERAAESNDPSVAGNEVEAAEEIGTDVTKKERTLLDDLKAAEESLSHAGEETTPMDEQKTLKIENGQMTGDEMTGSEIASGEVASGEVASGEAAGGEAATEPTAIEPILPTPVMPETETPSENTASEPTTEGAVGGVASNVGIAEKPEKVIEPSAGFNANASSNDMNKYGQMLQEALDSAPTPVEPMGPIVSDGLTSGDNPAVMGAPAVPMAPEINGVPEMNYAPVPGAEILPPPPMPPVEGMPMGMPVPGVQPEQMAPAAPMPEPAPVGGQPAVEEQMHAAQGDDPGAFRIPGIQ